MSAVSAVSPGQAALFEGLTASAGSAVSPARGYGGAPRRAACSRIAARLVRGIAVSPGFHRLARTALGRLHLGATPREPDPCATPPDPAAVFSVHAQPNPCALPAAPTGGPIFGLAGPPAHTPHTGGSGGGVSAAPRHTPQRTAAPSPFAMDWGSRGDFASRRPAANPGAGVFTKRILACGTTHQRQRKREHFK